MRALVSVFFWSLYLNHCVALCYSLHLHNKCVSICALTGQKPRKKQQIYAHTFSTMYNKNALTHQANSSFLSCRSQFVHYFLIRWYFHVQFAKKTTSLIFNKINQFSVGLRKGYEMVMFLQLFMSPGGFGVCFLLLLSSSSSAIFSLEQWLFHHLNYIW